MLQTAAPMPHGGFFVDHKTQTRELFLFILLRSRLFYPHFNTCFRHFKTQKACALSKQEHHQLTLSRLL